jgi:hypothetical protein
MSRPEPDPDLVLAALPPSERETVLAWVSRLGLDSFTECPPLRQLATLLAVLQVAGDIPAGSTGDRFRQAAEALGLEDDPERATHPADRYIRTVTGWLLAARNGKSFRPPAGPGA